MDLNQTLTEYVNSLSFEDLQKELDEWTRKANKAKEDLRIAENYRKLLYLAIQYKQTYDATRNNQDNRS